jgi:hypothetical protein
VTRDLGLGFKVTYERRSDGSHIVRFFRYGRRYDEMTFRAAAEDDALRLFTTIKAEVLLKRKPEAR